MTMISIHIILAMVSPAATFSEWWTSWLAKMTSTF